VIRKFAAYIFAVVCLYSIFLPDALAQQFKGKTISIYIGPGAPGGGYDLYGRMFGRYFGNHIPGRPVVIVRNMEGGSGIRLANYLAAAAPSDGTTVGMIADIAALSEALGTDGVRYRSAEFNWIGRMATSVNLTIVWHTSKVQSILDAKATPVLIGTGTPGGLAYQLPSALNAVIGTKFKLIPGYPSTVAMQLAMERGETEGTLAEWASLKAGHADWLHEKKVRPLVQYTMEREPDLPDVPAAYELGRTEEERRLLAFVLSEATIGRNLVAPPSVSPDIVKILRTAFDDTIRDTDFIAEANRANMPISFLSGEKLQAVVVGLTKTPAETIEQARRALNSR